MKVDAALDRSEGSLGRRAAAVAFNMFLLLWIRWKPKMCHVSCSDDATVRRYGLRTYVRTSSLLPAPADDERR